MSHSGFTNLHPADFGGVERAVSGRAISIQSRHEVRVFGGIQPPLEGRSNGHAVAPNQGGRVEPQPGEYLTA